MTEQKKFNKILQKLIILKYIKIKRYIILLFSKFKKDHSLYYIILKRKLNYVNLTTKYVYTNEGSEIKLSRTIVANRNDSVYIYIYI